MTFRRDRRQQNKQGREVGPPKWPCQKAVHVHTQPTSLNPSLYFKQRSMQKVGLSEGAQQRSR
jgi:hypothetical protein